MFLNRARNEVAREFCSQDPVPMFMDGEWVLGDSEAIPVLDPATSRPVCEVSSAGQEQVHRAVLAARRSYEQRHWAGLRPDQRAMALYRWADLLERDQQVLAELETIQTESQPRPRTDVARALDGIRSMRLRLAIFTVRSLTSVTSITATYFVSRSESSPR